MTEISALARALREGIDKDSSQGSIVPPIYVSTNFSFESFGRSRRYDYTRSGNPTRDYVGDAVSTLEGGAGGTVVATGMAAVLLTVTSLLDPGDLVAVPHDCYGGTWRLFDSYEHKGTYRTITLDFTDTDKTIAALQSERPKLVWLETPSNPLLRITDLARIIPEAHAAGALVVVDNTFLSPIGQRPFEFGADVVVHSATKYINGHSDVVQGIVVARTAELHERFQWWSNVIGITASPLDSALVLRGIRTLEVRVARHQRNAAAIAEAIRDHPAVQHIYYPGLAGHPGHDIARRQQRGFGAMVSIEIAGGLDGVQRFLDGLEIFSLAESLGGTESLVAHPETMTHASMTPEARAAAGITPGLLRLSIGIEPEADLLADLRAGLDRVIA